MGLVQDKVAIITGAGANIGEACAKMLAAQGAKVVVADINVVGAERVAGEIVSGGGTAFAHAVNLGDEASIVALVAGMIWGSKLGVQFSLSSIALRALPVVILGGLTSVPGAIIGGLIIGVGEKLSEVFLGPYVGGGIEIWFAYVLALGFLLVRPQGLFGEKIIDRV